MRRLAQCGGRPVGRQAPRNKGFTNSSGYWYSAGQAVRHGRLPVIHGADVVLVEELARHRLCRSGGKRSGCNWPRRTESARSDGHESLWSRPYYSVGAASGTSATAALAQSTSFCTVGPPLTPIAPTISPSTLMGNPPPYAATRASVGMPTKSDGSPWIKLKKSCVGRRTELYTPYSAPSRWKEFGAPSIRLKALRLPPSSRIATFSAMPSFLAFATASSTIFCASSEEMLCFFTTLAIGLTPT
jgi:hypothetical protein